MPSLTTLLTFLSIVSALTSISNANSKHLDEPNWWETTLIYQILPQAFQDSDGDGVGDLQGILNQLDYIEDLGVETICLNPIYSSPMLDSGYDISNYTDIDPIFGGLEDFNDLLENAHEREMKVILEIVPNHSSNEHEWFEASIKRIDPYTDYYIWANGTVDENGTRYPPNNWVSIWNDDEGSAWTWNEIRGQWYYHKFHETEPDLNLRNEDVIIEIMDILKFWLEKGVDGFKIIDVHYFYEDSELEDESEEEKEDSDDRFIHISENPETTYLLHLIREYIDNWTITNNSSSKLLLAESQDSDVNLISYYGDDEFLGVIPFNFRFITILEEYDNANETEFLIKSWLNLLPENVSTNWPLSDDDYPRVTTRFGENRVAGLTILTMLLPGQMYTYYGDEIAMNDAKPPWNETTNPLSNSLTPNFLVEYSRFSTRSPMQWNNGTSAGFSINETVYLPVNDDYTTRNVESQLEDPLSMLNIYKRVARLRKDPVFQRGQWELKALNDGEVLLLRRFLENHPSFYIIFINFGADKESVDLSSLYFGLDDDLEVILSTNDAYNHSSFSSDNVKLMPYAALVLRYDWDNDTLDNITSNEDDWYNYINLNNSEETDYNISTTDHSSTDSDEDFSTSTAYNMSSEEWHTTKSTIEKIDDTPSKSSSTKNNTIVILIISTSYILSFIYGKVF